MWKIINKLYSQWYNLYGDCAAGVGWQDDDQTIVFSRAVAAIPQKATSLVDIGCGLGHFADFPLPSIVYYGIDINPKYVEICKAKNLNVELGSAESLNTPHDCALALGTLHYPMNGALSQKLIKRAITHVMRFTKELFIFTLLAKNPHWPFYTERDIEKLCQGYQYRTELLCGKYYMIFMQKAD